jgi:hypothetical protein
MSETKEKIGFDSLYWRAARRFELRWQDAGWEKNHHVSTAQLIRVADLTVVGDNIEHGINHDPSPVSHTERLLDALPVRGTETFIDFGSGLGRVALLAARRFPEVMGVEFATKLTIDSERNIACYRGPLRCRPKIFNKDAAECEIPSDKELVIWFYSPFQPPVMKKVLDNLTNSFRQNPRRISVMYCAPFFRDLMDNVSWLKEQPLPIRRSFFKDRLKHVFYTSEAL